MCIVCCVTNYGLSLRYRDGLVYVPIQEVVWLVSDFCANLHRLFCDQLIHLQATKLYGYFRFNQSGLIFACTPILGFNSILEPTGFI